VTYAPDTIKAARTFMLSHLDIHPSSGGYAADLDPAEVGIVGNLVHAATGTSYHLGKSQLRSDSYSIVESSRDRAGLTDAASAEDIGTFAITVGGKTHTLRTFSAWLVAQCAAGTADTADIREVIYTPDGRTVHRWDRLKRRTTGDSSHLSHTHISWFRDSEHRDKTAVFHRYLTEIGLLEDDVSEQDVTNALEKFFAPTGKIADGNYSTQVGRDAFNQSVPNPFDPTGKKTEAWRLLQNTAQAVKAIAARSGVVDVDEGAIVAGVLAGLSPEKIAAGIPEGMAQQVVDLLAARLQG
jgi:hypothetical protein